MFGEESPVPPEHGADWFPEVIWALWRRENAIAWAVNWTKRFLSCTYWWLLTSVTFTNMDYTAIPFSCGIKQWHVCAIRVAQLLRVKLSSGASAVADIIVVRPWLDHLELSNQIASVVIRSWIGPLNYDLAFSPPRRTIEYIWVIWFPEPQSGKPYETYERDISIKRRRTNKQLI